MNSQRWRVAAGLAVLAALLAIAVILIPPYLENIKFQNYLEGVVDHPQSPELVRAAVVNKAAQMGLPVRAGDVHVTSQGNGVRVDIVYVVRVDFPLYTVDLHFHPSAGT